MEPGGPNSERVARVAAFASVGAISTTQQLAQISLEGTDGADPELVAEETLCLVATASARAAEVGLRDEPEVAAAVASVLLRLPFLYHDYLIGGAMVVSDDRSLVETSRGTYERLLRKNEFYAVHFPPDQFPGERALAEKMTFWLGRISPPGLSESPQDRLGRLGAVQPLLTHLKLVLAFGRQGGG